MARIAGVDLPNNKRTEIALTYIYGIGRARAKEILSMTSIDSNRKMKDINEEEIHKLREHIEKNYIVEGELRTEISFNFKRLMEIGCYRGLRHKKNLPVRGQKTKTNAKTRKSRKSAYGRKDKVNTYNPKARR